MFYFISVLASTCTNSVFPDSFSNVNIIVPSDEESPAQLWQCRLSQEESSGGEGPGSECRQEDPPGSCVSGFHAFVRTGKILTPHFTLKFGLGTKIGIGRLQLESDVDDLGFIPFVVRTITLKGSSFQDVCLSVR